MTTATLTSKGQMTLPKSVRERSGLCAGDRVQVEVDERRGVAVLTPLSSRVADLYGMLHDHAPAKPASMRAMRAAVAEGMRRRRE